MRNRDITFVIKMRNAAQGALNNLRANFAGAAGGASALNARMRATAQAAAQAAQGVNRIGGGGRGINTMTGQVNGLAKSLNRVGKAAGFVIGAFGIGAYVQLADEYKNLTARISLMTKTEEETVAVRQRLFDVSNRTRNAMTPTVDLYYRIARSAKVMGKSQNDAIRVTETINKAITISGSSAAAAAGAIIQLGQGMAAGAIRGQEFNSIAEQTPRVAEAAAKGLAELGLIGREVAEGLGSASKTVREASIGELRKFANDGKLTAELFYQALVTQTEKIDSEFAKFPVTVGQSLTVMRNSFIEAIGAMDAKTKGTEGLSKFFLELAATIRDPAFINAVTSIAQLIGNLLTVALKGVSLALSFVKNNMTLVLGVMGALGGGALVLAARWALVGGSLRIAAIAMRIFNAVAAMNPLVRFAVIIAAAASALYAMKDRLAITSSGMTTFGDLLSAIGDRVGPAFKMIGAWINKLMGWINNFNAGDSQLSFEDSAMSAAKSIDQIISFFMGLAAVISLIYQDISEAATSCWKWASDRAAEGMQSAVDNAPPMALAIMSIFQTVTNSMSTLAAATVNEIRSLRAEAADLQAQAAKTPGAVTGPKINAKPGRYVSAFKAAKFTGAQDGVRGLINDAKRAGARRRAAAGNTSNVNLDDPLGTAQPPLDEADKDKKKKGKKDGKSDAEKAMDDWASKVQQLQSTYAPLTAKTREFAETLGFLGATAGLSAADLDLANMSSEQFNLIMEKAKSKVAATDANLKAAGLTREQYNAIIDKTKYAMERELNPLFEVEEGLRNEQRVRNVGIGMRDIENKMIEAENVLRAQTAGVLTAEAKARLENYRSRLIAGQENTAEDTANNNAADEKKASDIQITAMGMLSAAKERYIALETRKLELNKSGIVDQTIINKLVADYNALLNNEEAAKQAQQSDWIGGMRQGLKSWADEVRNVAAATADLVQQNMGALATMVTDFALTGKLAFKDFARSAVASIMQVIVKMLLLKAIEMGLNAVVPGLGSATVGVTKLHSGGMAGSRGSGTANVSPGLFRNAQRLHKGGMPKSMRNAMGLKNGEVPAILLKNERVLNPEETKAYNAGGARGAMAGARQSTGAGAASFQGGDTTMTFAPQVLLDLSGGSQNGNGGGMPPEQMKEVSKQLEGDMKIFMSQWVQNEKRPGGMLYGKR